ncbi:hypothetical protein [Oscillatoria salina]|uniref:hypothetical protein n=1 Tax=Oscillatoria salina TaxID=331517 RepID=UPI0013B965C8|nr:hypothetical protein [Oscillatoria salina]MBZ8180501.1 hypothetical protein [Oscillatoria salina IIICB1]NET91424.1 hypothetical protein [Kamptonema sp. SIO1D9]
MLRVKLAKPKLTAIALTTTLISLPVSATVFHRETSSISSPPLTEELILAQSQYDRELLELTNAERRRQGLPPYGVTSGLKPRQVESLLI